MEIYLLKGEQFLGPFSTEAVQAMCASGEISATDYIWHADLPEWTKVGEVFPSGNAEKNGDRCGSCGEENISRAKFCPNCGKPIKTWSEPPPLPSSIKSQKSGATAARPIPWREVMEKYGAIRVIGGGTLILALLAGAICTLVGPPHKLQKNPELTHSLSAEEIETLSHFDRRDRGLFETKAGAWAFSDVRLGWNDGRITGPPSKTELEDFAIGRWDVFKISDEGKAIQRPDMDMSAARDCWVDEYERVFISTLSPLVKEARHNNAPAF